MQFVKRLVADRTDRLNCDLVKDVFVTREYRKRLRAQLIGILNGVLRPTGLTALCKKYSI